MAERMRCQPEGGNRYENTSTVSILRVAEALVDLDAKRDQGGDLSFLRGYSRALRNAIENNDWLLEVEALKSEGDVFLEFMMENPDERDTNYLTAWRLYDAAIFRCRDPFVLRTLIHRKYLAEKYILHPRAHTHKYTKVYRSPPSAIFDVARLVKNFKNKDSNPYMSRVAEIFQDVDQKKRQGYDEEALLEGYTTIMVVAIILQDTMVEIETLKSIGDMHLELGTAKKDIEQLCKARAVYKSAFKRYQNEASRDALQHRIGCVEKVLQRRKKSPVPLENLSRKNEAREEKGPLSSVLHHTTRSYDEHHIAGDTALQSGDLDTAERDFASALRKVHDPKLPQLHKEEECLHKLGNLYVQRGIRTKDGKDFAKAIALYNAAIARKGNKHALIASIKNAERLFLYHTVGIDCNPPPYDTDLEHKTCLKDYRSVVKVCLKVIHDEYNPYQYAEDSTLVKEMEIKRAEAVGDLFKDISEQRKDFIKDLVEECIKTIGPPPCKYAVIGLGSQATELVTPYSDLEFAILIEENKDTPQNKQYFLNLTCYLYLKVINLGETILPAMAIKSLNDFDSEDKADDWFYDSVTPRGFAFDGAMPWASKTPFGRERTKNKPAISLIQTPAGMAEFQQHDIALAHGDHLSDILRYVSYLTGDQSLVDDYMARVIEALDKFNEQGRTTVAVRFARALLNTTLDQLEYLGQEITTKLIDIKMEVYRFPTVAVVNLGLLWGVYAASVWDVIQEMEEAGVITEENAHHLQVLVSISGELRLRTYVANGGQKENVSAMTAMQTRKGDIDETLFESVFYLPDQKMLFRYYYTAVPLKVYIVGVAFGFTTEFIAANGCGTLYEASSGFKACISETLLQFKAAISHSEDALKELEETKGTMTRNDYLLTKASFLDTIADSYRKIGDERKVISYYEQKLRVQQQMYGHTEKNYDIAFTYHNLALAYRAINDCKMSMKYCEQALAVSKALAGKIEVRPKNFPPMNDLMTGSSLTMIGLDWILKGNVKKGSSYVVEGIKILDPSRDVDALRYDPDKVNVASVENRLRDQYNLDENMEDITRHGQELSKLKGIYGKDTAHPDISRSLINLGDAWAKDPTNQSKAIHYYEDALNINKAFYGNDTAHPDIATALRKLGDIWKSLGDHEKAIGYYEETLQVVKAIHKVPHCNTANVLDDLGRVYFDVGNKDKSVACFEEALKISQEVYDQVAPNYLIGMQIAFTKLGLAKTLTEFGHASEGTRLEEEANKMMEKLAED